MRKLFLILMLLVGTVTYGQIWEGNGGKWLSEDIMSGSGSGGGGSQFEPLDPTFTYYTVSLYDSDRTTLLYSPYLFKAGEDIDLTKVVPSKTGHTFTAWVNEQGEPFTDNIIHAISQNQNVYAMWDMGRLSISYYLDGQFQGIQFYEEGETIKPLEAPFPYDAERDSCFVGWYNIPSDRKMPNRSLVATATIDRSYAINYTWAYDEGITGGGNPHQKMGYYATGILNIDKEYYQGILNTPPVHNSYKVESLYYYGFVSSLRTYLTNNSLDYPATFTIGDNIDRYLSLGTSSSDAILGAIKHFRSTAKIPQIYIANGLTNNYNHVFNSVFSAASQLVDFDFSEMTNLTEYGYPNGSTSFTGLNLMSPVLETILLPKNLEVFRGKLTRYCANPIYLPNVATFTWVYDYNGAFSNTDNVLTYVVASDTRFVWEYVSKDTVPTRRYAFINSKSTYKTRFVFEGGYLPQNSNNHPSSCFANGSNVEIAYHGKLGEWADESFKTNADLWGTLSQYTWIDLDAETE